MWRRALQELASGPVFSHLDYARNLSAAIGAALGGGRGRTSVSITEVSVCVSVCMGMCAACVCGVCVWRVCACACVHPDRRPA